MGGGGRMTADHGMKRRGGTGKATRKLITREDGERYKGEITDHGENLEEKLVWLSL